ncbi:hypothetical protein OROHE_015985 [Orobanche hederae]
MHPTHHAALKLLTGPEERLARPDSPRSEQRKDRLEALGRHTVFIQDAVDALHKVGRALDWLNISAAEEMGSVKSDLSNVDEALQVLPQLLKGEEESREAARLWRLQKEVELNATFDDSMTAAINRLGTPRQGYRVSGSRPEFHDPNVLWKQHVQCPAEIRLPTDRQHSPDDIKQWENHELMRDFVKFIRESTLFDRCKTLSECAKEFATRLERGVIPLQLAMLSKHRKGDRITHPEDWILSYEKSYEGMAIYQNRGKDVLENWWRDTEFDPRKQWPWRHEH